LSWHPYNHGNSGTGYGGYGYLKCKYKGDIFFHATGISKEDSAKYLDDYYLMNVLSISTSTLGYGTLLNKVDDSFVTAMKLKEQENVVSIEKGKVITIQPKKEEKPQGVQESLSELESKKMIGCYTETTDDSCDYPFLQVKFHSGVRYISPKEFRRKTAGGCSNCSDDLDETKSDEVVWDVDGSAYCPECAAFFQI
jgi:hypothetical protein